MNQDHMNPDLLLAAMRNGDSGVSRYLIFAIETVGTFIGLLFLFAAYLVIYRILSYLFRNKTAPVTQTQNKAA